MVGPNGSGKTTLLRLLRGEVAATEGEIRRAEKLRIVYFDQRRELDPNVTLRRALAPEGDSVIYQDRVDARGIVGREIPVQERATQSAGRAISGGERARVLIAQLMLQPADVLLLDEPTNDLDIPTLEILEESLLEFRGSLVLVTHDRYMLDRVSTIVLGLDGRGSAERFADYSQWETWQEERQLAALTGVQRVAARSTRRQRDCHPDAVKERNFPISKPASTQPSKSGSPPQKKYWKRSEPRPKIQPLPATAARLVSANAELEEAQTRVDELYARWAELEKKQA